MMPVKKELEFGELDPWREKVIIAAMTPNRVIGRGLKIPWHVPQDLKLFKKYTLGDTLILGRHTWESMKGMKLPKRRIIIISRRLKRVNGAEVFPDISSAVQALEGEDGRIFFAGGAGIYKEALDIADTMLLSVMRFEEEGNVYFPEWNPNDWQLHSVQPYDEFDLKNYVRIDKIRAEHHA